MRKRRDLSFAGAALSVWLAVVWGALPAAADPAVTGKVAAQGPQDRPWIVYIDQAPSAAAPAAAAPAAHLRLEQREHRFQPATLVVQKGQTIDFPNLDKSYHNVFSVSPDNEFDLGLYRGGVSKTLVLQTPGEVEVYCNIHPAMAARILVLQNPHFAEAGPDGSYRLDELPPGSYVLVAWSPQHVPQRRRIVIRAGATLRADFTLRPRQAEAGHLNKFGEQYGRYK